MSRIDDLAEDLIGRCEPGPAGTCRIHHLDRDEDGHCPEWRRAVSEIDDLLEQVRSEAGANRSVIAAHDAERRRALRERDEARAEVERLARAAYAVDRLREVADGRVQHRYEGECPSATEDHASRDLDCPACAALIVAATWRIDPEEAPR